VTHGTLWGYKVVIKIETSGRTDLAEYFRLSGVFELDDIGHTPFLAFIATEDSVEVRIVSNCIELFKLPDETPVMAQWRGEWRSDFSNSKLATAESFKSGEMNCCAQQKMSPRRLVRKAVFAISATSTSMKTELSAMCRTEARRRRLA
jgi:hypothetical protein